MGYSKFSMSYFSTNVGNRWIFNIEELELYSIFIYETLFGCNEKFYCEGSILEPEIRARNSAPATRNIDIMVMI